MTALLNAPATMTTQQTAPVSLLGEVVSYSLPSNVITTKAKIQAALVSAGLDPKYARGLCLRHAFVRALRKAAKGKLFGLTDKTYVELPALLEKTATAKRMGHRDRIRASQCLLAMAKHNQHVIESERPVSVEVTGAVDHDHIHRIDPDAFADFITLLADRKPGKLLPNGHQESVHQAHSSPQATDIPPSESGS